MEVAQQAVRLDQEVSLEAVPEDGFRFAGIFAGRFGPYNRQMFVGCGTSPEAARDDAISKAQEAAAVD